MRPLIIALVFVCACDPPAPDGGDGGSCPPDRPALCDGECVDLDSDPSHCGACGASCDRGQPCDDGACGCADPASTRCGAACVDTTTDPEHCGACGASCGSGGRCATGACACASSELTSCAGAGCVDLQTHSEHCGACGNPCPEGTSCREGECGCSDSALTLCAAECVDLASDPEHCGMCESACEEGATCGSGACDCTPPAEHQLTSGVNDDATHIALASGEGGLAVVFADGSDVFFQLLSTDAAPAGDPVLLTSGDVWATHLVASGEEWFAAWERRDDGATSVQRLDVRGEPIGVALEVEVPRTSTGVPVQSQALALAHTPDLGLVLFRVSSRSDLYMRVLDASPSADVLLGEAGAVDVAVGPDHEIGVAWVTLGASGGDLWFQQIDPDGTLRGEPAQLDLDRSLYVGGIRIAHDGTGFVVAYQASVGFEACCGEYSIIAEYVSNPRADLVLDVEPYEVRAGEPRRLWLREPALAQIDGEVVVVWQREQEIDLGARIHVAYMSPGATLSVRESGVLMDRPVVDWAPMSVASSASGSVAVAWQDLRWSNTDVYVSAFEPGCTP